MTSTYNINKLFVIAALTAITVLSASCGRVGDIIPPGSVVPGPPQGLVAEMKEGAVILVWGAPASNSRGGPMSDLAGYRVMRALLAEDEEDCPCLYGEVATIDLEYPVGAIIRGGRVAWSDSGETLEAGRSYSYKVLAFNTDGYEGEGVESGPVEYVMPPGRVEGLTAEPGEGSVGLSWEAVPGASGYLVYRVEDESAPLEAPLNREPVAEPAFRDEDLVNNEEYFYAVSALTGGSPPYAEGPASGLVAATPADRTPPPAPSGLLAVQGEGFVLLSWEPVTVPDMKGYHVYRSKAGREDVERLTDAPIGHVTYRDEGVSAGEYAYYVSAVDRADPPNESPRSEPATSH